ncbi:MAG: hypothetical protein H6867_05020 [Rhodospirillales bacterium]|nr:hypothetical protein [Rhodospirillales bacterium]MCB9994890.1 hypothetical protein [Rhodospirillales bacterium]
METKYSKLGEEESLEAVRTLHGLYLALLQDGQMQLSGVIERCLHDIEGILRESQSFDLSAEIENIFMQFHVVDGFLHLPASEREVFLDFISDA